PVAEPRPGQAVRVEPRPDRQGEDRGVEQQPEPAGRQHCAQRWRSPDVLSGSPRPTPTDSWSWTPTACTSHRRSSGSCTRTLSSASPPWLTTPRTTGRRVLHEPQFILIDENGFRSDRMATATKPIFVGACENGTVGRRRRSGFTSAPT